jgi:nucleoside-diphosphate-sugar epimerase
LAALDAASSIGPVFEIDDGSGGYTWNDVVRAVEGISTGRVRQLSIPNAMLTIAGTIGSFAAATGLTTPFLTRNKAREIMFGDWRVNPARRLPDWKPHTSLQTGFRKTLEWYRAHQ